MKIVDPAPIANAVWWNNRMDPAVPWKEAYATVEREARKVCERLTHSVSTNEIVKTLYPEADARGPEGQAARDRIFKALAALATHGLSDCASRGEPRKSFVAKDGARTVRPWLWHSPTSPNPESRGAKTEGPLVWTVTWEQPSLAGSQVASIVLFTPADVGLLEGLIRRVYPMATPVVTGPMPLGQAVKP